MHSIDSLTCSDQRRRNLHYWAVFFFERPNVREIVMHCYVYPRFKSYSIYFLLNVALIIAYVLAAVFFLLNWPVNVKIQLKFSSGIYCSVFSSIHGNRVSRPPSVKKIVLCSQNIGGDWCELLCSCWERVYIASNPWGVGVGASGRWEAELAHVMMVTQPMMRGH